MDNVKLVGKVYSEKLTGKEIQMITGCKGSSRTTLGLGDLTLKQLGRFCSLFKCQPSDLLDLGENECKKYLNTKHDLSRLWALQNGTINEFCKKTGIHYRAVKEKHDLPLPMICVAAYKLGCKISDLVDMEEK